jgi:hypothetical protein
MRPQARIIYSIERFENRIRLVIIDYTGWKIYPLHISLIPAAYSTQRLPPKLGQGANLSGSRL